MGKSRVVIKVSPKKSKGGTIIARQVVKVNKTKRPEGKPMFQTKAQIDVHLTNKNGQRRR
jgi:hypothetical protein